MKNSCIFILALFLIMSSGSAHGATYHVYSGDSIQNAVDNAISGDTIIVHDGTYSENVNIDKPLTIQSENGYASTTVTALDFFDHVFEITSDNVTIEGFTLFGAIYGGVFMGEDGETTILFAGISLKDSNYCRLANNRCDSDYEQSNNVGIMLDSSDNNTITGNICSKNLYYVYCPWPSLLALPVPGFGIYLLNSHNNMITDNMCQDNNEAGIALRESNENTVSGNTCSGNIMAHPYEGAGIMLSDSQDNILSDNTCEFNNNGISIWRSNASIFYLNNFIGNTIATIESEESINTWHSPGVLTYQYGGRLHRSYLGNYYSNHNLSDLNGDGITDDSYGLPGDEPDDEYPLAMTSDHYSILSSAGDGDSNTCFISTIFQE